MDILQKINREEDEAEIASAVDRLAVLASPALRSDDLRQLQSTITQIGQSRRESILSENGLNLLIETTHDLSRTLELPSLFRTIVSRARSLVGANLAWVTILDEDSGLFRSVASEGYLSPSAAVMTSNFEYGAVSLIMQSKSFFDTQDYLNDTRFKHLPELEAIAAEGARAALRDAHQKAWNEANREAVDAHTKWIEERGTFHDQCGER